MKEEIDAAADFLSRIFLSHEKIAKEKVQEFNANLAEALQERFRDHWHESFPTKGQAYRCIRICPEEQLDPLLEKVCNQVGVCVTEFNLPMELTLWVDPKEVVCKFGDLKCSYHVVARKDQNSGTMNNKTEQLDIEDLVESARELYQKKQSMMTHPLNSSEIHIPGYCADGSSNRFSTALRINGTMHYNIYSTSPGSTYDGSPRGKGKSANSPHHKRTGNNGGGGGFHYYGKSNGGKGGFMSNGTSNGHSGLNNHQGGGGGGFHRNHHHHHHHSHSQGSPAAYQNGYLNGYHEENGYPTYNDTRSVSPSKMNGGGGGGGNGGGGQSNGLPPLASMSQGSPTPEQIQQQMQHPPPMPPPPIPPHLHQPYSQPPPPPSDPASLSLPPPPPGSQQQQSQQPSQSVSSSANFASNTTASPSISSSISSGGSSSTNNGNNNNNHGGKMSNHNNHNGHVGGSKFQSNRGGSAGSRGNNNGRPMSSPVKDVK